MEAQEIAEDWGRCDTCPKPFLLPDNHMSYELFSIVRGQFIVAGMGEIIGLDYGTVITVLNLYRDKVEDRQFTFEKIVYLSGLDMLHMKEERDKKDKDLKDKEDKDKKPQVKGYDNY